MRKIINKIREVIYLTSESYPISEERLRLGVNQVKSKNNGSSQLKGKLWQGTPKWCKSFFSKDYSEFLNAYGTDMHGLHIFTKTWPALAEQRAAFNRRHCAGAQLEARVYTKEEAVYAFNRIFGTLAIINPQGPELQFIKGNNVRLLGQYIDGRYGYTCNLHGYDDMIAFIFVGEAWYYVAERSSIVLEKPQSEDCLGDALFVVVKEVRLERETSDAKTDVFRAGFCLSKQQEVESLALFQNGFIVETLTYDEKPAPSVLEDDLIAFSWKAEEKAEEVCSRKGEYRAMSTTYFLCGAYPSVSM